MMSVPMKAILLSLLLVLLQGQSGSTTYQVGSQTYQYVYGTGSSTGSTTDRGTTAQTTYTADSYYTAPVTSGHSQTITCPLNQVYNNILCECVCILGYYKASGSCKAFDPQNPICGNNEIYVDKRCSCNYGYNLIGTICDVCPPYSTYILSTLSCQCITGYELVVGQCLKTYVPPTVTPVPSVPQCGINEELVNNICNCLANFYLVKGVCTYCATPNYYDPQLAICRPVCGTNEQLELSSLTCVCIGGFKSINGVCSTCQAYSIYNSYTKVCDCISGYTFSSGFCIPATSAPLAPVATPVAPRACADINAYLINGVCVCKPSYYLISSICQQCPTTTFYDPDLGICRVPCPANQVYNIVSGQCACATSFYMINGVCTQCQGESTYNPQTKQCSCPVGYRADAAGNCVVGCGVNEILKNGQCCCKVNFYPVNGVCGQCNWNEVYDQGLGICRVPCDAKHIFDISKKACVCLPIYFEMADGTCDVCVVNSEYDEITKTCVCKPGYIKNLGLCTPSCNAYEDYVNGNCACKEGYYLIGYTCGLCPPTQTYDATYRICHAPCQNNEVWDPVIRACRCLPGYYLVNGICSQCDPKTQVYDQKNQCCDCKSGYKKVSGQGCHGVCTSICSVNQDWLLNRCSCKPGYYLINNYCTQCPSGQFYDIYQRICRIKCNTNQVYNFNSGKCDCAVGYYIINGICSQCEAEETYNEYSQSCNRVPCKGINEVFSESTQTCICSSRYIRIRGVCTNCNPGQYYDSYSGRCLCKPGYIEKNGFCNPTCPTNSTYINGKCICENGLAVVNGQCPASIICPLFSSYNVKAECCVCNTGYRVINGQCSSYQYCGLNGYLKYGQCYCNDGFFWILSACRPCGTNEAFNGVACECYVGYNRDYNGVCQKSNFKPNCYDNERYDAALKACVCVDGTQYIRGHCVEIPTCPTHAYYNSISCVCQTGYYLIGGQCAAINVVVPTCPTNAYFNGVGCTCNIGVFQQSLNACVSCPIGTTWNGQSCGTLPVQTCLDGYVYNSNIGQCEASAPSCGDKAYFNGATCVCLTGYNFIGGVCQSCPAGTVFDGSQCTTTTVVTVTCGSNQVAVDGVCVCNSGLYLIDGACLACPAYTTWNGKFCQCGCDTSAWCLGQPFSSWDSATSICNCQTGYTRVNGICSA